MDLRRSIGMAKVFYLGKNGQYIGPLSEDDLTSMRIEGTLSAFFWLWDCSLKSWQPLEAPPPMPVEAEIGGENGLLPQASALESAVPVEEDRLESLDLSEVAALKLEALVYNRKHFLRGKIIEVSGKRLFVWSQSADRSSFVCGSEIHLMLYHTETGESEVAKAKVIAHKKKGRNWLYEFSLEQIPTHWQDGRAA